MHQILANLLENAIKYTRQGGVTLRVGYAEIVLIAEVVDTGIGIPQAEIPSIFEPFERLRSSGQGEGGTGLGLAIAHRLVNRMGGSIAVESVSGHGSIFTVKIPAAAVSAPDRSGVTGEPDAPVTGYRRTAGSGSLRILVTDDESENRQILRGLLEPLGFLVEEASGGEECLEKARSWRPDLISMDLRMPGLDGLEATRRIRALPALSAVPIVAVSAAAFAEDRGKALSAGCNASLAKPLLADELMRTLATLLPLDWVRVVPSPETAPDLELQALSPVQAERLAGLVRAGGITAIKVFAEGLAETNCCPQLARYIKRRAEHFDIVALRRLVEELGASAT